MIVNIHLLDFEKLFSGDIRMLKTFLSAALIVLFFGGCSATWSGVQQDTSNAVNWTKGQVNKGASYVKEKTE